MSIADTGDLHKSHDHSDLGHTHDPFEAAPPRPCRPRKLWRPPAKFCGRWLHPFASRSCFKLHESERCVHELVGALGVTQPLISQHLRVLKAAGVVRGERNGREVLYRLVDDHLAHIVVDAVAHAEEG